MGERQETVHGEEERHTIEMRRQEEGERVETGNTDLLLRASLDWFLYSSIAKGKNFLEAPAL